MLKVNCKVCDKEFNKAPSQVKRHPNHFCSRSCSASYTNTHRIRKTNGVILECVNCRQPVVRSPNQLEKYNYVYCSKKCQAEAEYTRYIRDWKDGKNDGSKGSRGNTSKHVRKYIMEKHSNCCVKCGQNEVWNNEPLTLHLDHIDGKCENNTEENLRVLCPNCHTQTPTFGRKNKNISVRYKGYIRMSDGLKV